MQMSSPQAALSTLGAIAALAAGCAEMATVDCPGNAAPQADVGPAAMTTMVGAPLELDGSGSSDPDGDTLTYSWSMVDGAASTLSTTQGATTTFTPSAAGVYTFRLDVSDGCAADDAMIEVTAMAAGCDDNRAPEAVAGAAEGLLAGAAFTLDGTGSTDADGDALTFAWTQTGGPGGTLTDDAEQAAGFVAVEGGTYVFELTVSDGCTSDSTTLEIDVAARLETLVASAFDSGADDWTLTSNGAVTAPQWTVEDRRIEQNFSVGAGVGYFAAPDKFVGDQSAAFGGLLRFRLGAEAVTTISAPLVIIAGPAGQIEFGLSEQPGAGQQSFSIALDASAGWSLVGAGRPATDDEIRAVLAEIELLRIRGEFPANSVAVLGWLDDVELLGHGG